MKSEAIYPVTKSFVLIIATIAFLYGIYTTVKEVGIHFLLKNNLMEQEMIELARNIKSINVETNTKLLEDKIDELDKKIKDLAKSRNQEITQVGNIISRLEATIKEMPSNIHIDASLPSRTFDETLVYTKDADGENFPVAQVFYNPYYEGDKWTTRTYPIKFSTNIAIGENQDGSDAYVETWMENTDIEDLKGKKFPIKLASVNWVKKPLKDKHLMWNTRLSQMSSIGTGFYLGLGISAASYGRTERDMDWMFLQLGLGGNNEYGYLHFSPFEYNIGGYIPLVNNFFVGPSISIDNKALINYGMGLSIPF